MNRVERKGEIDRRGRNFSFRVMPAIILPDGTEDPWWGDESNGFYRSELRKPASDVEARHGKVAEHPS